MAMKKLNSKQLKVIPRGQRFVIAKDTGKVVDDAHGWGYKTEEKANRAMWYLFGGGKQKMEVREKVKREFFAEHKGLNEFLREIWVDNCKWILLGEFTDEDIIDEVREKFGIELPKEYVEGLDI
jgi:DNA primase catalytic subunit